jgi:hypothetical protein
MSSEHPFAPGIQPSTSVESGHVVTPQMREAMRATRRWVMLLSILGFLLGGIVVIFGLLAAAGLMIETTETGGPGVDPAGVVAIALLLPLSGGACLVCGYALLRYAVHAGDFAKLGHPEMLVAAMRAQRNFWRLIGMMTVLGFVLWFGTVFVGVALE